MVPFAAAYWRARRTMAEHQDLGRRAARRTPLPVLLAGEVRWMVSRVRRAIRERAGR